MTAATAHPVRVGLAEAARSALRSVLFGIHFYVIRSKALDGPARHRESARSQSTSGFFMPVRLPAIGSIAAHLEVHAVKRKPRCDAESHGQKVRHIVRWPKKHPRTAVWHSYAVARESRACVPAYMYR